VITFDDRHDGPENMGRDAALLIQAESGEPAGRVYGWTGNWVTLGRFQKQEKVLLENAPVDWVQRPTGGKAVLHGHDVTFGLAVPLKSLGLSDRDCRSVGAVYRRLIRPIVLAMQDAGGDAELAENTPFVRSAGHTADCFAHIAPNDVVNPQTGQKVCGCALKLTQQAVLIQASIPAARPLVDPARVFRNPHSAAWITVDAERFAESLELQLSKSLCPKVS
jgi:lipoate-protein ligase A